MAKAVFFNDTKYRVASIKEEKPLKIKFGSGTNYKSSIEEVLPFRIKFMSIGLNAYGPGNAAPIGIAIIGLNNYVM
jgi:hypothetical protein